MKTGILNGFLELDEKLRKIPEVANGEDKSGTTAVCALITEKHVLFSNCGDSRGVLSSGGANPVLVTQGGGGHNAQCRNPFTCVGWDSNLTIRIPYPWFNCICFNSLFDSL